MQTELIQDSSFEKHGIRNQSTMHALTPILFGSAAFQYLNGASEVGLFELLHTKQQLSNIEIADELGLDQYPIDVLLLGTTSLGLTKKENDLYSNSDLINQLMQGPTWELIKDVIAFQQYIVYKGNADFTESLRKNTNIGLNSIPGVGADLYNRLPQTPALKNLFYKFMHSWTKLSNHFLFNNIDFSTIKNMIDVGGGTGINAIELAKLYPNLRVTILEIPEVATLAQKNIEKAGLTNRVKVFSGNIFTDEYPEGHDCILFSHLLPIWSPEENISLLTRAYKALPSGGNVLIFSAIYSEEEKGSLVPAMHSMYFLTVASGKGMIYSVDNYEEWLKTAGFSATKMRRFDAWTSHAIVEGIK